MGACAPLECWSVRVWRSLLETTGLLIGPLAVPLGGTFGRCPETECTRLKHGASRASQVDGLRPDLALTFVRLRPSWADLDWHPGGRVVCSTARWSHICAAPSGATLHRWGGLRVRRPLAPPCTDGAVFDLGGPLLAPLAGSCARRAGSSAPNRWCAWMARATQLRGKRSARCSRACLGTGGGRGGRQTLVVGVYCGLGSPNVQTSPGKALRRTETHGTRWNRRFSHG